MIASDETANIVALAGSVVQRTPVVNKAVFSMPNIVPTVKIYRINPSTGEQYLVDAPLCDPLKRTLFPKSSTASPIGPTPPKISRIMPKNKNKNTKDGKASGNTTPHSQDTDLELVGSESGESSESVLTIPQFGENVDFQTEVRGMFKSINDALTGDGENQKGLIKRVKIVEKELYGDNKMEKGLCKQVETLETQVKKKTVQQATAAVRSEG